jgi:hypothetical protein
MDVLALVVLAVAVAVALAVLRAVASARREYRVPPRDLERTSASVVAEERAEAESRTEPPEPAVPAPAEPPRATIPPTVAEALATEPETASESVPAPAPTPTPAPAPAPTPAPAAAPVAVAADPASIEADDLERKKASKLARLVVSEIKLYNEKLVAEGLAAGDLYIRLKEPIDQSVLLFERRVPEAVRAEFDYMDYELVRQLAGGDASKLGSHYVRLRRG